jgi:hypothetical protein
MRKRQGPLFVLSFFDVPPQDDSSKLATYNSGLPLLVPSVPQSSTEPPRSRSSSTKTEIERAQFRSSARVAGLKYRTLLIGTLSANS